MSASAEEHLSGPGRGRGERRTWWVAFAVLLAATSAWAVAMPPMTGPDEWAHAFRAAAVVRGELTGTPTEPPFGNATVRVPEALSDAGAASSCHLGEPRERLWDVAYVPGPSDCPELRGGSSLVTVQTSEHRGQPLYYALVGLPTLPFPSVFGTYLMRLVGAVLCSALLASAFTSLLRLRANRLVVLGGAAAVTPAALYLAGVTNTAGLEMAATLSLWATGAVLVRGDDEPDRRLVHRAGAALVLLVLARGLSPAYAALALAVLALLARPGRVRTLLGRADVRAWGAATAVAVVASGAWLLYVHEDFEMPPREGIGLANAVEELRWDLRDLVGMFGSTDVLPPVAVHLTWLAAVVAVFAVAWRRGRRGGGRGEVLLGVGLCVGAVALLLSGEGLNFPDTDVWWQGRYVAPLIIGALVVATLGPRSPVGPARPTVDGGARRLGPPLLGLLVALHAWCFLYAVRHYVVGHEGPRNPVEFLADAEWSPPLAPAAAWAGLYVAALAAGAGLLWRASAPAQGNEERVPDDADGRGQLNALSASA